jgi:CBS domain-containing protein
MKLIKHVLEEKGSAVWSISPRASVYEAIQYMADKEVGALVVMEEQLLAGLVSERDYARKVILAGRSSRSTLVRDIMTERVVCGRPGQTVFESMAVMTERRIRHLPILEAGSLVGIVSMGDLVKAIIAEQEFTIAQLEHYINA